jgi:hypothetical protein
MTKIWSRLFSLRARGAAPADRRAQHIHKHGAVGSGKVTFVMQLDGDGD